jgi:hypothetical protein
MRGAFLPNSHHLSMLFPPFAELASKYINEFLLTEDVKTMTQKPNDEVKRQISQENLSENDRMMN